MRGHDPKPSRPSGAPDGEVAPGPVVRVRIRNGTAVPAPGLPAAVLFDRDGTLIDDVPYNGNPALVRPVPGALAALATLRALRVPVGVVSNQSGVAGGALGLGDVLRVNARVEALLGPLDVWAFCPHDAGEGCGCRKPAPGLVVEAAAHLGVPARDCVVIGDIGADVEAAQAVGARGVLVPTPRTLPEEVRGAMWVAPTLTAAVRLAVSYAGSLTAPPQPGGEAGARPGPNDSEPGGARRQGGGAYRATTLRATGRRGL